MAKTLEISGSLASNIEKILEKAGKDLKQEMEICELSCLRISIDLNREMPGPIMGVKYMASKFQSAEIVYDSNLGDKKTTKKSPT
jgi:hypothetical protein